MASRTTAPGPGCFWWAACALSLVALGCSKKSEERKKAEEEKVETVAWNSPGITKLEPGSKARYAVRDGPVGAFFTDTGLALSLGSTGTGLHWTLVGARKVKPRPEAALPGRVHDLRGDRSDWQSDQRTYGRLVYESVYPGISLTLETRRHAVAYRFDVAAGADPGAIRIRYEGAEKVWVDDRGGLRVRAGGRVLRESGLHCFQEGAKKKTTDVRCDYRVKTAPEDGFDVTLDFGPYDRSRPLIIDPEIGWWSRVGGGID